MTDVNRYRMERRSSLEWSHDRGASTRRLVRNSDGNVARYSARSRRERFHVDLKAKAVNHKPIALRAVNSGANKIEGSAVQKLKQAPKKAFFAVKGAFDQAMPEAEGVDAKIAGEVIGQATKEAKTAKTGLQKTKGAIDRLGVTADRLEAGHERRTSRWAHQSLKAESKAEKFHAKADAKMVQKFQEQKYQEAFHYKRGGYARTRARMKERKAARAAKRASGRGLRGRFSAFRGFAGKALNFLLKPWKAIAAFVGALGTAIAGLAVVFGILFVFLCFALGNMESNNQSSGGYGSLGEVEMQVVSFLREKGLPDIQIAGIMGNIWGESRFDPTCAEPTYSTSGRLDWAYGMFQWGSGRGVALLRWAAENRMDWKDPKVQLKYFWEVDQGGWPNAFMTTRYRVGGGYANPSPANGTLVSGSYSGFMNATTVKEATEQYCYSWERPGFPRINERIEMAEKYYAMMQAPSDIIVQTAYKYLGGTYILGKQIPEARTFDCSGLTQYAYRLAGIEIPRTSTAQHAAAPYKTTDLSQAVPGDIVWCPGHVGIYIGNGQTIEAIDPQSGIDFGSLYYFTHVLKYR
jgi:cell wall-associated NlpC family hydrolase